MPKFLGVLQEYVTDDKVVAVTTDNAGNMKKAIKKLGKFQWFGCFGHTLNLVVKRALRKSTLPMSDIPDLLQSDNSDNNDSEEPESENAENDQEAIPPQSKAKRDKSGFEVLKLKFKKLVKFTHKSTNAKDEFKQCQETAKLKIKALMQDCATRWNRDARNAQIKFSHL